MPAEPVDPRGGDGLVRVRLDLGYDGTAFAGWARQPGQRTVQGVLEEALARVVRQTAPPALTVAGRTDAGVHARGQVAHVDLTAQAWNELPGRSRRLPDAALVARLAGVLPPDVRVWAATAAPAGFDARFSALWRRYAYRLADDPAAFDPLTRGHVLWHPRRLDLTAMTAAAALLLGEHDFAAFCRRRPGGSTVRRLLELSWSRTADGCAVATAGADAFCHSMVRALVGALLVVGEGRRPVEWPRSVLAAGIRDAAVPVVPARGLTLEAVGYPPDADLASRARLTRAGRFAGPGCT